MWFEAFFGLSVLFEAQFGLLLFATCYLLSPRYLSLIILQLILLVFTLIPISTVYYGIKMSCIITIKQQKLFSPDIWIARIVIGDAQRTIEYHDDQIFI